MHEKRGIFRARRVVVALLAIGTPIAILCCGGGDDTNAPKDGGGGETDGTVGKDGGLGGSDSGQSDGSISDGGSDANVCTASPCVIQLAAGGDQTCALIADGTVRCWGQNRFGQMGVGGLADGGFDASVITTPVQVPGIAGATQILTTDWGPQVQFATPPGSGLSGFSCARIGTSSVQCWGTNRDYELGRGDASAAFGEQNPAPGAVVGLVNVTSIAADGRDSCALLSGGAISCWGYESAGELGPSQPGGDTPYAIPFMLEAGAATQVAVGRYHSCALVASGQVLCWGENDESELGGVDAASSGGPQPVPIPGVFNVVELKASGYQTCGRTSAGDVICWGRANMGQLGRDAGVGVDSAGAGRVDLPAGKKATAIGLGTNHACALLDDDSLWCWGRNFGHGFTTPPNGAPGGQIGPTPDGGSTSSPQHIVGLSGKVLQVVGGYAHTCALIQGGSVECWGSNHAGELGNGTADELAHPMPSPVIF